MRTLLVLLSLLLLSACASSQKFQRARTEYSKFNAELHDRDIVESCADQAAPGTTANLECQLAAQKQAEQKTDAPKH